MKFTYLFNKDVPITSFYGWRVINGVKDFHHGIDALTGDRWNWYFPVQTNGIGMKFRVTRNDWVKYYCKQLKKTVLQHYVKFLDLSDKDKYEFFIIHTAECNYKKGDVARSKVYGGKTGNTGCVVGKNGGYHTHIELTKNGKRVNPLDYFETYKKDGQVYLRMYIPKEPAKNTEVPVPVPENAPKTDETVPGDTSSIPDNLNNTPMEESTTPEVVNQPKIVSQETLQERLKNTTDYAGKVLGVSAAFGVLLSYFFNLPELVVIAMTTIIGFVFNMIYDIVLWKMSKGIDSK